MSNMTMLEFEELCGSCDIEIDASILSRFKKGMIIQHNSGNRFNVNAVGDKELFVTNIKDREEKKVPLKKIEFYTPIDVEEMDYIQEIGLKILSVVKEKQKSSEVKNYMFYIERDNILCGLNTVEHRYEPLNETHQLCYHLYNIEGLSSYIVEDEDKMSHIINPILCPTFPNTITYRAFITSILDCFWSPYIKTQNTSALEKHLINMFSEIKINYVVFDTTKDSSIRRLANSNKSVNKLFELLNSKLSVSLMFIANKSDGELIDYKKLDVNKSSSLTVENISRS